MVTVSTEVRHVLNTNAYEKYIFKSNNKITRESINYNSQNYEPAYQ